MEVVESNFKKFLDIRLKSIVNKLDLLNSTNQCTDDEIFSEFIKLKNELVKDIKTLYNNDNIKFEINYELDNTSILTFKALNNFTFYLLQGYEYKVVVEMNVTGDDLIVKPYNHYESLLNGNFRKHEL